MEKEILRERGPWEKGVTMEPRFELFVGNLRDYTEGSLNGDYLSLPMPEPELRQFIRDRVAFREDHEELLIMENSLPKELGYLKEQIGESSSLTDLNMLAHLLKTYPLNQEAVELYLSNHKYLDTREIGNLLLQSEELPYSEYRFQGSQEPKVWSILNEKERYGHTIAEANGAHAGLEKLGMSAYLDYEAIGRDASINGIVLGEHGYLDTGAAGDLDLGYYSMKELYEEAGLEYQTLKELMEKEPVLEPELSPRL